MPAPLARSADLPARNGGVPAPESNSRRGGASSCSLYEIHDPGSRYTPRSRNFSICGRKTSRSYSACLYGGLSR